MPQVIVIDEIGTKLEAIAASTIAQRGIQLAATAHDVTLGDEEASRRGIQKTVLERKGPSTFSCAAEIVLKIEVRVHHSLEATVDALLAASSRMKYGASRLKNFKKAKTAKNVNSRNNASPDYHSDRRLFGDECAFCHSFRITEASGPMYCYKDGKLTALEEANQPAWNICS
ncbi:hypothetical protein ZIOFF_065450 [Zingiber officinale]|uniref:Uncharacterized protein n=1 Tax=Zingiber officinale TaxID=94328 RepID=A0A8J5EXB9_ZINOF|nr:hypothetical protein ZIOFF_065450 [Zingiber officinale]